MKRKQISQGKIAVLHHLGAGNLGDESALASVIENVVRRWPDAQVTAFTMNPWDTSARYGVPALPIRTHTWAMGYETSADPARQSKPRGLKGWLATTRNPLVRIPRAFFREGAFFLRAYRTIRKFDLLAVSGGGQLTGRSGPWGFPFGIFIWMLMAKLAGVRRVILNVGVGPLNSRLVTFFSIGSLRLADYASFRDERSEGLARREGYRGNGRVVTDNAYLLDVSSLVKPVVPRAHRVVGISPMPYPWCDPQEIESGHQQIYDDFIGKLASFSVSLIKSGYRVELFGNDVGVDPRAIRDVHAVLRDRHQIELPGYRADNTVAELLTRTAALDYVVTCRFHGVVLAHILNKPVLALAHHPKVSTLMADLGLSQYCCDIATFDVDWLTDAFASMVYHTADIQQTMEANLALYREKLTAQYDEVFPPMRGKLRVLAAPPSSGEKAGPQAVSSNFSRGR